MVEKNLAQTLRWMWTKLRATSPNTTCRKRRVIRTTLWSNYEIRALFTSDRAERSREDGKGHLDARALLWPLRVLI